MRDAKSFGKPAPKISVWEIHFPRFDDGKMRARHPRSLCELSLIQTKLRPL